MDLNIYQKQAMRTSPDDHDRVENGCLGLIGESGEIVDIIKKHMFQSKADTPLPADKIIEEMGDVLWYCAETATGIGKPLGDFMSGIPVYSHYYIFCNSRTNIEKAAALMAHFATKVYIEHELDSSVDIIFAAIYDVYRCLMHMCDLIDTTMDEVGEINIKKLKKRYPDGFDPERSMNRPEYQRKEKTEAAPGFLFNQRNRTI